LRNKCGFRERSALPSRFFSRGARATGRYQTLFNEATLYYGERARGHRVSGREQ